MLDPISLLNTKGVASLLGGVGSGLGGGAPAGPSNATAAAYGSGQDNSGWAVNFAGVQSAGSSQDKSGGVPGLGISGVGGVPGWAWIALAAVIGVAAWRKSKR